MIDELSAYRKRKQKSAWDVINEFDEIFGHPSRMSLASESDFLQENTKFNYEPPMEIVELPSSYVLTGELPGVVGEDIKIEHAGSRLMISCEAQGSFSKTFIIPGNVDMDDLQASFTDGTLRIIMPKVRTDRPHMMQVRPFRQQDPTLTSH